MSWILVLYFICGGGAGCRAPAPVTLPLTYATEQECIEAGNVRLNPNANPTVASFACTRTKVFDGSHPERNQE
jgi:hypothetical protein